MPVTAQLLGEASLCHAGTWRRLPAGKTSALLYYLILQDAWVRREALIYLFWPDIEDARARNNLRRLLSALRRADYAADVEIEATRLRFLVDSDVKRFREALAAQRFASAVEIYRGELLAGYDLATAREFEDWLALERHALRSAWRDGATALAHDFEARGQFGQAASVLERVYATDEFDEALLRPYLAALHRAERRHRALEVFEHFRSTLEREFGGEPDAETVELVAAIRRGEADVPVATRARMVARHNLPPATTPFVGREIEKARVGELLLDPACRLVSIVGPGGYGKTRLALEVAGLHRERFPDGAWFVPLAPVTEPERMAYAVAEAVAAPLESHHDAATQLLDLLRERELLLILDNVEQLLPDTGLISEILQGAPRVTILATSRERLGLQAERVQPLAGLLLDGDDPHASDAVTLFRQSARGVGVALEEEATAAVLRICRLTGGMPLAIELAAKWTRVLPLRELVAEIEGCLDVLQASARDRPPRHESVRAVFDHSYALLSAGERSVFGALSVFQGGFRREAAAAVAGGGLGVLAALVDKSLLGVGPQGRYDLHPLLHRYARERLAEHPRDERRTVEAHGRYYLRLLQDLKEETGELQRLERLELAEEERANIARAWSWAVANGQAEELQRSLAVLEDPEYCSVLFYPRERLEMYAAAVRVLEDTDAESAVLRRFYFELAGAEWDLGRYREAERSLGRGRALLRGSAEPLDAMRDARTMSDLCWVQGDYPRSKRYADEALELARRAGGPKDVANALVYVANVIKDVPTIPDDEALAFYRAGLAEIETLGSSVGLVGFTHLYAFFLLHRGGVEEAERRQRANLERARRHGYRAWEPGILDCLAMAAFKRGDHARADRLLRQAYAQIRRQDRAFLKAYVLGNLGRVSRALGDEERARAYLLQSFDIGSKTGSAYSMASTLAAWAGLDLGQGRHEAAASWASLCLHHPATESHARIEARGLLEELRGRLSPAAYESAVERGRALDLTAVVREILAEGDGD